MDAYEATKVVFARIQGLDPDHAAKIMGLLLIQDHGEKEMIRLAFGPEALLHAVMAKARKDLGLLPGSGPGTPTSASAAGHSPFMLSRQNSGRSCGMGGGTAPSPLSVSSPSSWAPPPVFSRSNSVSNGAAEEMAGVREELMSPANGGGGPPSPFFGGDSLILDELHLQDQLAFLSDSGMGGGGRQLPQFDNGECRSPSAGDFPYGAGWANGGPGHRRSASVSELCFGGSDGLGWKPCLYYARGYCKNGSACRFVHGGGFSDDALTGAKMDQAAMEQQCQDFLLRSKSQRLAAAAAAFPYTPTGSLPGSPSAASKCLSLLLQQQQQNESQRAAAAAAAAALMLGGDEAHKFMGRPRLDRADFASMLNPGSRQIYLTFPADSTFREEDVSNYFSIYGPVHDVRIPYQQKRMFGFVTFVYPETVNLILAKGNPHFICDARVLVKPYKEKGKVPDKFRKQPGLDFPSCGSPTGLDARDPFDLHQLGARMLQHSNSANEMLLRRKLEEQQQAVELQQAIELQSRRLMGLQLLDLKSRSAAASPTPIGNPFSPKHTAAGSPNQSPPDSGNQNLFTVQFEHNGYFSGLRGELSYDCGSVDHFDYCDLGTFSSADIASIRRFFDYKDDGKMHLYWCMPGKGFEDGLHLIYTEEDVRAMVQAAAEQRRICVLADHTDFVWNLRPDMVTTIAHVENRNASEEPNETEPVTENARTGKSALGQLENENVLKDSEDDSDCDSDFHDSDYDVEDGDDDLFADNVDKQVHDNNATEDDFHLENDEGLDDTDLRLRNGDEQLLQNKLCVFNPSVDLDNPVFKPGMIFSSVEELRKALNAYSVRNRIKIKKVKNDQRRVDVVCKPGCPWFLKASKDSITGGFVIRSYFMGQHTCQASWELKTLTAPFLCQRFLDEIRDNQKMDLKTFAAKVQREFNMCPNRWKLGRARKEALNIINGDEDGQFALLLDFGQELRRSNPGSRFHLTTNRVAGVGDEPAKEHLATLYWSFDACKRGFLEGCRPIIFLDGCHIKTKYKGQLLTAVGIDGNDCIYPIAMALVEVECTSSWEWFLTTLRDDLNITNTSPFTIMSDKQKGLINAVTKIWPDAEHRFCVRHLYQNFQKAGNRGEVLKNNLWAIARSTNIPRWQHNLEKMRADSREAYEWVEKLAPNTWIKAFFSDFPKCDVLLNNHSEVFNSYILEAREMPILSMMHTIFYKIEARIVAKQKEVEKWTGTVCPKIKKKIDKFTEWSKKCFVDPAAKGLYHVSSLEFEKEYVVDMPTKTCTCNRWQLTGIPCHHAIACCREDRFDVDDLVHSCYKIDTYKRAYAYNLVPLRGRVHWEKMNGVVVLPPLYTKVMGRPKKNRRKAPEEKEKNGATHVSRGGITMHCSICGQANHNKKGHYKYVQTNPATDPTHEDVQDQDREGYDDTSILQHIIPIQTNPSTDPTHARDSMVYNMGQEERGNVGTNRSYGPLPGESTFVGAARDSIPAAKVRQTTVTVRGRGRAKSTSTRGRGRSTGQTQGRGRKRKPTSEDARASTHSEPIPDLNAPSQADEVVVTQGAPTRCCEFECTSYSERCIFNNQPV